jgi:hypothetical protein
MAKPQVERAYRIRKRLSACRARITRAVEAHGYTDAQVREMMARCKMVINTFFEWGPTDDGTDAGHAFEESLILLSGQLRHMNL